MNNTKQEIEKSLIDKWFMTHESLSKNEYIIMKDMYTFVIDNIVIRQKTETKNIETKTKKCYKCKRILPVNEFYGNVGMKDGLQAYCKHCQKLHNIALKQARNMLKYENKQKKIGDELT